MSAKSSLTLRRRIVRGVRFTVIAYLIVLLLMMWFEERLIFIPNVGGIDDWNPAGLALEDAQFQADDGVRLHGWFVPHASPRVAVLYAHGNGGNITLRADLLRRLHRLGAETLIFDYRGYDKSDGSPNEPGILLDARAARKWLCERTGRKENEIVLMGRSLGGGVAVDLAADGGAAGLALESTFTSLPDAAAKHYPWLPVRWLMRTRLDSISKIKRYKGPLLQSHGTADRIVPYESGRTLFDAAIDPQKKFIDISGGDHNDPQSNEYYRTLDAFFDRIAAPS